MKELYLRYKSISVFSRVAERISPLAALTVCEGDELESLKNAARVFSRVAESGSDTTGEWIVKLLHEDDNVFSRAAACGKRIPDRIKAQVSNELLTFKQLALIKPDSFRTERIKDYFPRFGYGGMDATVDKLTAFYAKNGCGDVSCGAAFVYRGGALSPVATPSVRLSDIKNYAEEKAELVKNTENFIAGRPAFHALLCGDRGTGKTTTVRAVANEYRDKLKIIEIPRGENGIASLITRLSGLSQKFILFVDDLAIDADSDSAPINAELDGILDAPISNVLLYCTSDGKPHTATEREQTELDLVDKFGLVITYLNPDRDGFTDILKQILRSRSVKWRDEYASVAELAARKKGGRTPYAAKQIADIIESTYAEARG